MPRPKIPSDEVDVIVEIPQGSRNKYEYDERTGRFRLDRVLFASVHYPTEIENFFATYKTLEGKVTEVVGWENEKSAWDLIRRSRAAFRTTKGGAA